MTKTYTIELNEKRLVMLDQALDLVARFRMGQLYIGPVQDLLEEMWLKRHPDEKIGSDAWHDMRTGLELTLKELQFRIWSFLPGQSLGVGHDNLADCLFDMHKCMEHARFLSLPKERQEKMAWSVMADEPRRYGDQPLIKVKEQVEPAPTPKN
jgi:hypothetical protein